MSEYRIRDKCHVNSNRDADHFVGIVCDKNDISVHFPLGFHISDDDRELRRDIMLLVATISSTIGHRESGIKYSMEKCHETGFPIQAYLTVINDYLRNAYICFLIGEVN